jgi:hypothetical protein
MIYFYLQPFIKLFYLKIRKAFVSVTIYSYRHDHMNLFLHKDRYYHLQKY